MRVKPIVLSISVLAPFLLAAPLSRADTGLSLSSAIETAVKNSPELRKAELLEDSASWGKLEELSAHLPHIDVRGTHFLDAKYSVLGVNFGGSSVSFPSAYPQTDFTFEASLLLFDGLGSINRYRAARLEHEAAQLELNYVRFKLEERVAVRYQQALAAQGLVRVAQRNIETLEQHLKLAQASQYAGVSTKVDVLRIEALLEEARADQLLAADNVVVVRNALNQVMGIERDERPLVGELPIPDPSKVPAGLALDVSRRPDLEAQTRREDAQGRLSSAANSAFFPRVSIFGAEQFYKYGDFDPAVIPSSSFVNAYAVGLRVSWNLFDGGGTVARNRRADDAAKIEAEHGRELLLTSPNEFDLWKRRFIYNTALFSARKRAEAKSAESARLATIAVKAGTKTHAEALDAELELFRARAGVIRAQVDAAEALSNLEVALGHRL